MYFAVDGLPRAPAHDDATRMPSAESLVRSVPVVIVADPGTKLNTGTLLFTQPCPSLFVSHLKACMSK